MNLKLVTVLILGVGCMGTAQPAVRLAAELKDGSRILGHPKLDKLPLETDFGRLEPAISVISTVEILDGGKARLLMQNGDRLQGVLKIEKLDLETIFAPVTLPLACIRRIQVFMQNSNMLAGLALYYTFDENAEKAVDASGNNRDGELVEVKIDLNGGRRGGAAEVVDRVGEIVVANSANLPLKEFTLAVWVKRANAENTSGGPWHCALFAARGLGGLMGMESDGRLYMGRGDGSRQISTIRISDTVWHHLAAVRSKEHVTFYVDGQKVEQLELSTHIELKNGLSIGSIGNRIGYPFIGRMDEVMIFERPLSDSEIQQLWQQAPH